MGDQRIRCVECGREFVWTDGEQQYYKERGLTPPKRCKDCRSQRAQTRSHSAGILPSHSAAPRDDRTQMLVSQLRHTAVWFGAAMFALTFGVMAALIASGYVPNPLLAWLISITLVTFLAFWYDKAVAGSNWTRVPEKVLFALTLLGGTVGALVGRRVFHHKTRKVEFRVKFWLIVVIQVAVVGGLYWLLR